MSLEKLVCRVAGKAEMLPPCGAFCFGIVPDGYFVPQASQSSPYRRDEFDIRLAIPSTLKRLRKGEFYEYITGM